MEKSASEAAWRIEQTGALRGREITEGFLNDAKGNSRQQGTNGFT